MIAALDEEAPRAPRLFDAEDLPWIAGLLDIVERSCGEPWRVLVERVEHAPLRIHRAHRSAMLVALRRMLGGAGQRGRIARSVRALVLGPPALEPGEREARLAAAAQQLGTTAEDVESLLWVDLAMERPVALPSGRPLESDVAALANLERIQRCVRRAHDLKLRVWERANELVRMVARYGLIAQIERDGDATLFDVIGPLALFHSTMVYGRALAALVPLLADHARFALELHCRFRGEPAHLCVEPPVLLPPVVAAAHRAPSIAERLARDLAARGHTVQHEPPPIACEQHLLFPDLAIEHDSRQRFVEVIGFSTQDHVTAKLERYRLSGIPDVVLCVDLASAPGCDVDARICTFTKLVDVDDLLATLAG